MTRFVLYLLLLLGGLTTPVARAAVRLPAFFADHMILQRDRPVRLWGRANADERITVRLAGHQATAAADADGRWEVHLPALPAGGPHQLEINDLTLRDVLMGDVWLASGQSNMEWKMGQLRPRYDTTIARADYPRLRYLDVADQVAYGPLDDVTTTGWQLTTPTTVINMSAVAFFFARDLQDRLGVPIGIIQSEWGGTPAEAWTSAGTLREQLPAYREAIDALTAPAGSFADPLKAMNEWRAAADEMDAGYQQGVPRWAAADFSPRNWPTLAVPGVWEPVLKDYDGVVWFRREVTVPAALRGKALTLQLGTIDDDDQTWFNGTLVGQTSGYAAPRRYPVPAALVRPGKNVITVRVTDTGGGGGFWGKAKEMTLSAGNRDVPLAGDWQYQMGVEAGKLPPVPSTGGAQNLPTTLYNGMIAPLVGLGLKGVIWYQGEANAGRAYEYRTLFPTMISDWRQRWGQGDLPFLFVQLANFMQPYDAPRASDWAELREAQSMALSLPNTGQAVIIDLGEANDIHPKNKRDVGRRLALAARHVAYHDDVVYSGPVYRTFEVRGNQATVHFDHAAGLTTRGGAPGAFDVAGADRKFYRAQARLEGETVVLSHPQVPHPVAVRYGWANNPDQANLYNGANLPATPFRTDNWPGLTQPQ